MTARPAQAHPRAVPPSEMTLPWLGRTQDVTDTEPSMCRCGVQTVLMNACSDQYKCPGCGFVSALCRCVA